MNKQLNTTFDYIFDDFDFKIEHRAHNVTSYYNKEKNIRAQVDEKLLTLEVGDKLLDYSVKTLINELKIIN